MKKFKTSANKTVLILAIIVIMLGVCYGGHYLFELEKTKHNHNLITEYIDTKLTYQSANHETEKATLIDFTTWTHMYDADLGRVYERLSLIYQDEGSTVEYYDALGKALYYLERGENIDYAANIYADLSNYYLTHNEYDMAQEMLNRIYERIDIDTLSKGQVTSYIYRLQGILYIENGYYDEGYIQLQNAKKYIYQDDASIYFGPSYEAITDTALANYYYQTRDYDSCREIVDKYEDCEFFTASDYREVLVRDFIIPYYKVAINITVRDKDDERTDKFLHEFMTICKKYKYRNIELSQLTYMQKKLPTDNEEFSKEVSKEIQYCYEAINNELYSQHALLIDNQIEFASSNEKDKHDKENKKNRTIIRTLFIGIGLFFLIIVLCRVIFLSSKDGLTRIGNRRALDSKIRGYIRSGHPYSIIMMDIDNFKHVNDTYGHEKGDEVLIGLGKILKDEKKGGFIPYRYGGEEFIVLIDGLRQQETIEKAEKIRIAMSNQTWSGIDGNITISLGVAGLHHSNEDVIKIADSNLYYSKQHGKNIVTYCDHGYQTLYTKNQTSAAHTAE